MHRLCKLVFLALITTIALASPVRGQDDVILPADAIDAIEILDEPGVSQNIVPLGGAGAIAIVAVEDSINAPSNGYVLAFVSGRFVSLHVGGGDIVPNDVEYGLSPNCDVPSISDVEVRTLEFGGPGVSQFLHPVATQQVYPVSAGFQTFCLVSLVGAAQGSVGFEFNNLTLSLLFVPTAYGTVDTN